MKIGSENNCSSTKCLKLGSMYPNFKYFILNFTCVKWVNYSFKSGHVSST